MTKRFFIEQFVDTILGNSTYLVGSHASQQAVLIDPLRDVDRYQSAAEKLSVSITHIIDTHLHADFVSGARELAAQIGATVGASAEAKVGFDHRALIEGDTVSFGDLNLKVMRTPGHTPEHISFLLQQDSAPEALFSGGALIVGGAARTDLISHDLNEPLARQLYHTLHDKLLLLPDEVNVYPTHGAGSFCVAPTSSDRVTTIGRERKFNHLAQAQSEGEFVKRALSGLPSYPFYYQYLREVNQRGPKILGGVPKLTPLSAEETHGHIERGTIILDVRSLNAFAAGHIPGSYGIAVDTPLLIWVGWLIPFGAQLILVAKNDRQREEATRQLIRIGYDSILGYLEGGIDSWVKAGLKIESINEITVGKLRERLHGSGGITVLDVRQDDEWLAGHIPNAIHIENGRLAGDDLNLPKDRPIAVHCAHGFRAMAGISTLMRRGYTNVIQVKGGFSAWEEAGFEIERN